MLIKGQKYVENSNMDQPRSVPVIRIFVSDAIGAQLVNGRRTILLFIDIVVAPEFVWISNPYQIYHKDIYSTSVVFWGEGLLCHVFCLGCGNFHWLNPMMWCQKIKFIT